MIDVDETETLDESLIEKMEELKKNKESNSADFSVYFKGITVPIKNDKLKLNFQRIHEISKKIDEETDLNKKVNQFTDIYNILDEIQKIIKKERTEETQQTESILFFLLNKI